MIKVTSKKVVWVDITAGQGMQSKMDMLRVYRDFLQWQLSSNIWPVAKGHTGPLGYSGGYTEANAKVVLRWFRARLRKKARGVTPRA